MKIASVMTRDPRTLAVAAGVLANVNFLARKAAAKKWGLFRQAPEVDPEAERAGITYCYEDDEIDHVKQDMVRQCAHRLPVIDRRRRLVGIVSIDDVRAFSFSM
jgi:CBS domain-containing protein